MASSSSSPSSSTPASSLIWVVGPEESWKRRLVRNLISYESMLSQDHGKPGPESRRGGSVEEEGDEGDGVTSVQEEMTRWDVSTKYYTAALDLCLLPAMPSTITHAKGGEAEAEGIIMVFDTTRPDSFDEIKPWGPVAVSQDVGLRLCVGMATQEGAGGGGGASEAGLEERIGWCLDHGFEYVEADLLRPTVGHEEREKEGFPRVVESIYSTQWKSMKLLPPKKPGSSGTTSTTTGDRLGGPELATPQEEEEQQQQHGGKVMADSDASNRECSGGGHGGEGEAWGGELDDLDLMFDKIREMRSCAMNSGSLSDEDRRNKAAQLAMHLAKLLGIDGSDDEEGDKGEGGHGAEARRE